MFLGLYSNSVSAKMRDRTVNMENMILNVMRCPMLNLEAFKIINFFPPYSVTS